jgi:hypothetical protein
MTAPHWTDNLAAKVRATPAWVLFAWLIATAAIYYAFGGYILFGFATGITRHPEPKVKSAVVQKRRAFARAERDSDSHF